jgi:hypothetical protein
MFVHASATPFTRYLICVNAALEEEWGEGRAGDARPFADRGLVFRSYRGLVSMQLSLSMIF